MSQSVNDVQFRELKDMIIKLNTTIQRLNQTIDLQNKLLSEKDNALAEMKAELTLLRKKLYGASKERTVIENPDQLNFFNEFENEPEPIPEIIEPEYIEVTYKKPRKKKPSLSEQFKDIPIKQFVVDTLSDEEKECPVCSALMQPIGTEVIRREVVHVKPEMYMIEYVATTYGCPV